MVRRNAGPSRVQVPADAARAVVSRLHRRGTRTQPQSRAGRRSARALLNLSELTVVIITRDEERALPQALASLPAGARILVVDAQSQDGTRAIAEDHGATVVVRPWTDFVDARRFALAQVQTPWTFMLDADERLDAALREALCAAEPERTGAVGYRVRRATRFAGKTVAAFGWNDERLLRIFRTDRATLVARPAAGGSAPLHERWNVNGTVADLDGTLLHESYPSRAAYRRKFAAYTSIEAAGVHASLGSLARAVVTAPLRFLWLAGPRGGLRAGWRGLYLAFWSALYPLAVHYKAWRRRKVP